MAVMSCVLSISKLDKNKLASFLFPSARAARIRSLFILGGVLPPICQQGNKCSQAPLCVQTTHIEGFYFFPLDVARLLAYAVFLVWVELGKAASL